MQHGAVKCYALLPGDPARATQVIQRKNRRSGRRVGMTEASFSNQLQNDFEAVILS